MHDCPDCGQACYCDLDDTEMPDGAAECVHECEPEDEDFWDDDEDMEGSSYGGPQVELDDLQLGPVVQRWCLGCKGWTEHVVCEQTSEAWEYRCSQCFRWSKGVPEPVVYDPALHQEMTEGPECSEDDLPF